SGNRSARFNRSCGVSARDRIANSDETWGGDLGHISSARRHACSRVSGQSRDVSSRLRLSILQPVCGWQLETVPVAHCRWARYVPTRGKPVDLHAIEREGAIYFW